MVLNAIRRHRLHLYWACVHFHKGSRLMSNIANVQVGAVIPFTITPTWSDGLAHDESKITVTAVNADTISTITMTGQFTGTFTGVAAGVDNGHFVLTDAGSNSTVTAPFILTVEALPVITLVGATVNFG